MLPVCPTAKAMHKSVYRLREIIKHGPMRFPGRVHSHYFGSEDSAKIAAKSIYDDYSVSRVCFCKLYQKNLKQIYSNRPFNRAELTRFTKRLRAAIYRYLEAWVTGSKGYKVWFESMKKSLLPDSSNWPNQ